ncbi:putative cytochrome c subunit [Westerdykella ornata]|uniref:Cytochrome c oxidase subunit 8, mitochondrial n=1 Tax=Westerdykella ornata TaxID=318751 RepID=A0A6A6JPC2_WESOR|nr:putative cytochrome c subunit [Westerdykella ornata]KAF2278095.1 putative cytochrome c subunit [Westerdykella ornata]
MLSRSAFRAAANPTAVARRGFQSTRVSRGGHGPTAAGASPYHYPEGPRSNLPFDPLKKGFAFKFWGYAATGFFLPFGIAVWQTKKNKP